MSRRGVLHRWVGLVGIGARRLLGRTRGAGRTRIAMSVGGVAVAIALLLVVSGVAVGLAMEGTVHGEDANYVLMPAPTAGESVIAAPDNAPFGGAHQGTGALLEHDGVSAATPVLVDLERLETPTGDGSYLLVVGVIPEHAPGTVAGLPTDSFSAGTPYHDHGNWTGEAVLSAAGAEVFGLSTGDDLRIGDEPFQLVEVAEPRGQGAIAGSPVAVVHIAELQAVMGLAEHDQAHQFLVHADPAAESHLAAIYPGASVMSQTEMTARSAAEADLPLALGGTAFVVAGVIGTLFVMTAMGLEVLGDRRQLRTLGAIGFGRRSRFGIVATGTMLAVGIGGVLGTGAGFLGIAAMNHVVVAWTRLAAVAVSPWWFGLYGVAVATMIGIVTLPYLYVLTSRQTDPEGRT